MNERWVFLDTETTGLSPSDGHKIIEIGCVEVVGRQFTGKEYHQLVHPQRDIDEDAYRVHGIGLEQLKGAPVFSDVAQDFLAFVQGADEVIIHNASFDVGFLNAELGAANQPLMGTGTVCPKITDSLREARAKHGGQRNSLDELCRRYEIDHSKRIKHGALLDAQLLAEVYLKMTAGQEDLPLGHALATHEPVTTEQPESQPEVRQNEKPVTHAPLRLVKATDEEVRQDQEIRSRITTLGQQDS